MCVVCPYMLVCECVCVMRMCQRERVTENRWAFHFRLGRITSFVQSLTDHCVRFTRTRHQNSAHTETHNTQRVRVCVRLCCCVYLAHVSPSNINAIATPRQRRRTLELEVLLRPTTNVASDIRRQKYTVRVAVADRSREADNVAAASAIRVRLTIGGKWCDYVTAPHPHHRIAADTTLTKLRYNYGATSAKSSRADSKVQSD